MTVLKCKIDDVWVPVGGVGPEGPQGIQGIQGETGPQGEPGTPATIPVPIAQGGTNGTTEAAARTNLDVFSTGEVQGGHAMSGAGLTAMTFANAKYLALLEAGGTPRYVLGMNAAGAVSLGSATLPGALYIASSTQVTVDAPLISLVGILTSPHVVCASALVGVDGTLYWGLNVAFVSKVGTGHYRVTYTVTIPDNPIATVTPYYAFGFVQTQAPTPTASIDVFTANISGVATDISFALHVVATG